MAQETLYELYFAHIDGHIVDVRDITYIEKIHTRFSYDLEGEVDKQHARFSIIIKGIPEYQRIQFDFVDKAAAETARQVLVDAHAKLWLPFPEEEKAPEANMATEVSVAPTDSTEEVQENA
jgi:hypothetical protein